MARSPLGGEGFCADACQVVKIAQQTATGTIQHNALTFALRIGLTMNGINLGGDRFFFVEVRVAHARWNGLRLWHSSSGTARRRRGPTPARGRQGRDDKVF